MSAEESGVENMSRLLLGTRHLLSDEVERNAY